MEKPPVNYHSYLLRLWRTSSDGAWKASLEDTATGERMGFKSVQGLMAFLLKILDEVTAKNGRPSVEGQQTENDA